MEAACRSECAVQLGSHTVINTHVKAYKWTYCMCYSKICPNCHQQSNKIVQFRICPHLTYIAKQEQMYKVILDTVIKEREIQPTAVLMTLLLQTGCNSIPRDTHIFLFTEMSRTVLRLPHPFI